MDLKEFLELPAAERDALVELHTKQKQIHQKYLNAREEIAHWNKIIDNIQASCTHPMATKEAKADTGNWCPADDSYWYEYKCPDCGRFWQEDQRKS